MVTLGIDFASQPAKTAACFVRWRDGGAEVETLQVGVNNSDILGFCTRAQKIGIDVPFGWPLAFVQAVAAHAEGKEWPDFATPHRRRTSGVAEALLANRPSRLGDARRPRTLGDK